MTPETLLSDAAKIMKDKDLGSLPVGENDRLVGMLTDRDIVCRAVAADKNCSTTAVRDAMSQDILYIFEDQDTEEAARNMADNAIRRLPVVNRDKRLVGMLTLGDLADRANSKVAGQALHDIAQA
ncbi:MAG: CBS domain-containing protein [Rhodothalassiaceae bacterium]